ncbi:MAG: hypothetical protein AB7O47_13530 [Flavobacteriales bacterium]
MEKYSNLKKGSKIIGYELGSDYIKVWMKEEDEPMDFTAESVGIDRIEIMKDLAKKGYGLQRYINKRSNLGGY